MAEENLAKLARELSFRDLGAFSRLMENHGPRFFSFCLRICLGDIESAEKIFLLTLKRGFKDTEALRTSVENWFFGCFHQEWSRFALLRRRLWAKKLGLKFDWARAIGRQCEEALFLLTPLEREIVLYRFYAKLLLRDIQKITKLAPGKIVDIFRKATQKIVPV